jgi:hypothetical protein
MNRYPFPGTISTSDTPVQRWWRSVTAALLAGAAATAAIVLATPGVTGADEPCGNVTLKGEYGLLVTGVRAIGPQATENFSSISVRRFDGEGRFTQVDNVHGTMTGAARNVPASGRYQVNPDCSGMSMIFFPGAPPIETAFVILEKGDIIHDIVMTPQPNLVTSIARRIQR